MAFIKNNENKFRVILTDLGSKTLLSEGLLDSIYSFSLFDDNILYTLNVKNQPVPGITGDKINFTKIKNNLKNPLQNG
jgi:hypothetical protein